MKIRKLSTWILSIGLSWTLSVSAETQIFFEKSQDLPLVYVTIAIPGGATQDPAGKSGLSELTTKLMLRGTKLKTKQQINLLLDQLGANLGVETRAEFVAIRGNVLAENLTRFLALIEELLSKPAFPVAEFEKLRNEQISGLSDQLSSDRDLVKIRFDQYFFGSHPYARPAAGKIEDLKKISLNDIRQQYQKLVHPDRLMILASGDASKSDFEQFASRLQLNSWGAGALATLPPPTGAPNRLKVVLIDKPERTQTHVMIGQSGIAFNSPDVDALQLANYAFGGGSFQARLFAELRVKRGWTYGAASGFKFGTQPHSWRMMFFPKNADTPPAIKEALHMVRELREKGLTAAEFEFAQQSLMNGSGFLFNTPAKRMENKLVEKFFGLPEGYTRDTARRLSQITLPQVNEALKRFLNPQQMLITVVATANTSRAEIARALNIPEADIQVVNFRDE